MEDTEKLRKIVATIAETKADFAETAHLRDDLRVDSIRGLELVFEIERELGVKIPDDRYGEVETFADIVKLVSSLK
jgi:acyl carrier protein